MIARHFRSLSVTLLLIAAAGAAIATSAWTMEVKSSRNLQLAIVDARQPAPAREALHRAFAARLATAASARAGGPVEISARCVSAREARVRLDARACDAVLVFGDDRPLALRRLEALTLCGELDPETGTRPAYLIVGQDDAAMRDLLAAAFANVLADRAALKSFELAECVAANAPSGSKVAALVP